MAMAGLPLTSCMFPFIITTLLPPRLEAPLALTVAAELEPPTMPFCLPLLEEEEAGWVVLMPAAPCCFLLLLPVGGLLSLEEVERLALSAAS